MKVYQFRLGGIAPECAAALAAFHIALVNSTVSAGTLLGILPKCALGAGSTGDYG